MKFSCEQSTLSKALNIVSKAITNRTTIPVLEGIMLKADENGFLTMSASDLEISIEKKFKVDVKEAGEVVVQAKLFGDIVRKLPNSTIHIENIGNNINIVYENSEFNVVGSSADEFPKINIEEEAMKSVTLPKSKINYLIKKTTFAASIDEARGIITGVLFDFKKEKIEVVALDGFRMAICKEEASLDEENKIIINAKIVNEISKIISEMEGEDQDDNMELSYNEKRASFTIDDTIVSLRLMDGEFLNYERIIPTDKNTQIKVNKSDFQNCVERASLFTKIGKNNLITLKIDDSTMIIESKSEEGDGRESVNIEKSGEDIIIGFNAKYMMDCLKNIDDEEISIDFIDSKKPGYIHPVDGEKYKYIVFPVRIANS